jgi:quercetin dioxygenase-like cupin family protein
MMIRNFQQVPQQPVEMEGATGCQVRWLVGPDQGAPNFAMRQFEVAPEGHTPKHHHPYEHEVYVLEGEGLILEGEQQRPLRAGDVVLVAPDEVHQFRNTGPQPLKFLCLVPNSAMAPQVPAPECGR